MRTADQTLILRAQLRATGETIHNVNNLLCYYTFLADLSEFAVEYDDRVERVETVVRRFCCTGVLRPDWSNEFTLAV